MAGRMKVTELKVGQLYKIRSDRETHVIIRHGRLDVHLGNGAFKFASRIRPMDYFIYLGCNAGARELIYRGQKLRAWPNIWQHIVPMGQK